MLKLTSSCILMAYVSEIKMSGDELALKYFGPKLHNEVNFTVGNMQTIITARLHKDASYCSLLLLTIGKKKFVISGEIH